MKISLRKIESLKLFLLGVIVFSPVSSKLMLDLLQFPLALPELLVIPFIPIITRHFKFAIKARGIFSAAIFTVFMILAAIVSSDFGIYAILSTARGYFYIMFVYFLFRSKHDINWNSLYLICWGSVFGWVGLAALSTSLTILGLSQDNNIAVYGNYIALALTIAIPIYKTQRARVLYVFFVVAMLCLFSGLRRVILISVLSYIVAILLNPNIFNRRNLISLIAGIATLYLLFSPIRNVVKEHSQNLYIRIFLKSESLISSERSESDRTRFSHFSNFRNTMDEHWLPRGFVTKQTMADNAGGYMDAPYKEFRHMFGILLGSLVLLFSMVNLVVLIIIFIKVKSIKSYVGLVLFAVVTALFGVEGSFLNFTYIVPFTGLSLSLMFPIKTTISK